MLVSPVSVRLYVGTYAINMVPSLLTGLIKERAYHK